MRNLILMLSSASFLAFAAPQQLPKKLITSPMEFVVDVSHSKVAFEVEHLKFSTVGGNFTDFEGTGSFDPSDLTKTSLQASVKTESVSTDNAKRDNHLKSADFFDVKKFPLMTFNSVRAEKSGEKTFKLIGNITIKGVTKEVVFDCKVIGETDVGSIQRVAVRGTTLIDRTHFNVNFNQMVDSVPIAGKDVTIIISVEAISKKHVK